MDTYAASLLWSLSVLRRCVPPLGSDAGADVVRGVEEDPTNQRLERETLPLLVDRLLALGPGPLLSAREPRVLAAEVRAERGVRRLRAHEFPEHTVCPTPA